MPRHLGEKVKTDAPENLCTQTFSLPSSTSKAMLKIEVLIHLAAPSFLAARKAMDAIHSQHDMHGVISYVCQRFAPVNPLTLCVRLVQYYASDQPILRVCTRIPRIGKWVTVLWKKPSCGILTTAKAILLNEIAFLSRTRKYSQDTPQLFAPLWGCPSSARIQLLLQCH